MFKGFALVLSFGAILLAFSMAVIPGVRELLEKNNRYRKVFVAILIISAAALSGCATPPGYGPEEFWNGVGNRVVMPRFSSPAMERFGITPGGHNIVLTDGTPFWCSWWAYGTELGKTGPGDQLVGSKYFEPLSPQIPIAVLCYKDPGFTQYVGAAGRVLRFATGQPGGISWALQAREIQTPEGTRSSAVLGRNYPLPPTTLSGRRVELPREALNGTGGVQLVNNTLLTVTSSVNGGNQVSIPSGAPYYVSVSTLFGPGQMMSGQLIFTDADSRLVGTYDYRFAVPSNGVVARQLIVSPWMIRR